METCQEGHNEKFVAFSIEVAGLAFSWGKKGDYSPKKALKKKQK